MHHLGIAGDKEYLTSSEQLLRQSRHYCGVMETHI